MTKTLNNESLTTANGLQALTVSTQCGHSKTTQESLIGLDCVIEKLKQIRDNYKAAGKRQRAEGVDRAIVVVRGMVV